MTNIYNTLYTSHDQFKERIAHVVYSLAKLLHIHFSLIHGRSTLCKHNCDPLFNIICSFVIIDSFYLHVYIYDFNKFHNVFNNELFYVSMML